MAHIGSNSTPAANAASSYYVQWIILISPLALKPCPDEETQRKRVHFSVRPTQRLNAVFLSMTVPMVCQSSLPGEIQLHSQANLSRQIGQSS